MARVSDRYGESEKKGSAKFEYAQRDDKLGECLEHQVAMENAPESDGIFFKVPKVIER
jgi:aspartyl-tRNA(Asn)/glutamyl-tRNA(Gln) amidotransferase subunit C